MKRYYFSGILLQKVYDFSGILLQRVYDFPRPKESVSTIKTIIKHGNMQYSAG